MNITQLGWNEYFQKEFIPYEKQGFTVGRVVLEHKHLYRIITKNGECAAEVSGKLRYQAITREDYPAVGDWVVVTERLDEEKATIHAILPRFSKFSRKVAGVTTEEQIVASNVDTIFLIQSLNQDFNARRLERYLIMAWESGANPIIVLTKADICTDLQMHLNKVEQVALGVPIHVISVVTRIGLEELETYFQPGKTVALLGSSGTGKSTLTNYLLREERQKVQYIREDDARGRHTTTSRELYLLPSGGLVLDTPGMRELQLWEADTGFSNGFEDIEELSQGCYFRDCTHQNEPKCMVKKAIVEGILLEERLQSYFKLQKELAYLERKNDKAAQTVEKEKWKKINKSMRQKQK